MNPYGQPQQGSVQAPPSPEQPKIYYDDYVKARSRLRWAFGYAFVSAVGNLVLAAYYALLTMSDIQLQSTNQTRTTAYAVTASVSVVMAIALVVLGIFMMRRSRIAVGIAIGVGVVVGVLTVIQALALGTFLGITGVALFLYLTIPAYRAVSIVRAYEAEHPKK